MDLQRESGCYGLICTNNRRLYEVPQKCAGTSSLTRTDEVVELNSIQCVVSLWGAFFFGPVTRSTKLMCAVNETASHDNLAMNCYERANMTDSDYNSLCSVPVQCSGACWQLMEEGRNGILRLIIDKGNGERGQRCDLQCCKIARLTLMAGFRWTAVVNRDRTEDQSGLRTVWSNSSASRVNRVEWKSLKKRKLADNAQNKAVTYCDVKSIGVHRSGHVILLTIGTVRISVFFSTGEGIFLYPLFREDPCAQELQWPWWCGCSRRWNWWIVLVLANNFVHNFDDSIYTPRAVSMGPSSLRFINYKGSCDVIV